MPFFQIDVKFSLLTFGYDPDFKNNVAACRNELNVYIFAMNLETQLCLPGKAA